MVAQWRTLKVRNAMAPELFLLGLGFILWMVGMLTAASEQDDEFTQTAGFVFRPTTLSQLKNESTAPP